MRRNKMEFGLCVEMALEKLPFEDRIKKAAEIGFKRVEMWFVDMSFKGKPEELARIAEDNQVKISMDGRGRANSPCKFGAKLWVRRESRYNYCLQRNLLIKRF